MKKIVISIITVFVVVFGVQAITSVLSDTVKVQLRNHTFLIPKHIAMERESVVPIWLLNMSDLDDGSSTTLFRFDDIEIQKHIPSYKIAPDNQFQDDIEGLIIALTSEEVSRYKTPNAYAQLGDLWRTTGSYHHRKIEPAEMPGWYKVYREVEYPKSWALLSRYPDSKQPIPEQTQDFWIAHCLLLGPAGKESGSCGTYKLIDDVVIEFHVSDYNLHLLDEIKGFVVTQVRKWKQP